MQPEPAGVDPRLTALVGVVRRAAAQPLPPEEHCVALRALGLSEDDLSALEEPTTRSRLELYRTLVHGRIRGALEVSIPETVARLGPARTAELVARFVAERGSRSPYLRDVAREVLDFATETWPGDRLGPPYLEDLARYELVGFEVGAAEDDEPALARDVVATDGLRFQKAARLLRLEHAVHRLEPGDGREPDASAVGILAYRDPEGRARRLELTAYAAAALERLLAGESLVDAARGAASDAGLPLDDRSLADLAALLEDLEARGALLGAGDVRSRA